MFRFVLLVSCLALVCAQNYNKNPQHAAILSEQRYLSGGKFGAAYTQEDGTDFKEETDADGTRHGSYSYIDPTGQKRTVSYTAGKNGFQASGDHLPVAPPAPPQPIPQPQYQPQPQYNPQPQQQYNAQPASRGFNDYGDDGSYDERYNDPSFSQNGQQSSFRAAPAPAPVHAPAPQQPQYNYNNQQQNYNPQPQPQYNQQQYQTTPQPRNFQPPGKLQLNRTPDGFSYSFNKV